MKTVASLPPQEIAELVKVMKREHIPCETRIVEEASGLGTTELLVNEDDYEKACELVESWQDAIAAERQRKHTRHCPKCGSQSWEPVMDDAHFQKAELMVRRCKVCGCLIPT